MHPLARLQDLLAADAIDATPDWPGAYALAIRLDHAVKVERPYASALEAGWHVYAGSAKGPGGVGARLRRHLAREKRPHWHVDRLTTAAGDLAAVAYRRQTECDIVRALEAAGGFVHRLPGFGSSDCRRCQSHLLSVEA